MEFAEAREVVLDVLRHAGKAKNSQMLEVLGGDEVLLEKVREDLIFDDLAEDKKGVGLIYIGPTDETDALGTDEGESSPAIRPPANADPDLPSPATAEPDQGERPQVFISYGRLDAKQLADRLSVDLAGRGYKVWQDVQEIRARHPWHREIEDGLRSSQIVVALLSPHSVRSRADQENPADSDSVCLDEISYAQYELRLPIVPVMAAPCSPPLFIHRLDYVDLCAWTHSDDQYQAGLRRLVDALEDARQGRPRYRSWEHDLKPWDFAPFLSQKHRDFCGRQWLFDEIDAWRTSSDEPALLITGDPGTGKSAVVAQLLHLNPGSQVLAYHCCQADTPATLEPWRFVRSLAAMIASQSDAYAAQLDDPSIKEHLSESACREDPATSLERGILTPLESLHAPDDGARYLLVDALDEALTKQTPGLTIVDLLATRLNRMPGWLRVVATTRKEPEVLDRLGGLRARELDTQEEQNLRDLRQYIRLRLESPNLAAALAHGDRSAGDVTDVLVDRSEGNFLYVQQALEGVERQQVTLSDLDTLPPGLGALYETFFRRHFPDRNAFAPVRRVLEVAVAAAEPLTADDLASATGLDPQDELPILLEQLAVYLPARPGPDGAPCYSVYHKSLSDWLTDPQRRGKPYAASAKKGHAHLAQLCMVQYGRSVEAMSGYALSHLPTHLIEAECWDDLETVLIDLLYLEARVAAGQVFDVACDFSAAVTALPEDRPQRQILKLLNEALRRDIHFIARHAEDYPQGLFQCLWNTCWWYDSRAAVKYYASGKAPGDYKRRPLSELLEAWRTNKEGTTTGFSWLASVHPPAMHLGTAQKAVLRGHEDWVLCVSYSPDGRRIASGSRDNTVRVWDAESGAELAVLRGHEGEVQSVSYSPDGRRIASGSGDETVRVWDTESGAELAVLRGHVRRVNSVSYSPDSRRLAIGGDDHTVRVWDATSGAELAVLHGHEMDVNSVSYSPDGRRIVSGSQDGTVRVWDTESGAGLAVLRGDRLNVRSVSYSPDGRRIASTDEDGLVRVWDAESGAGLAVLGARESRGYSVSYSPDGRRIVSGSRDGTVRVRDVESASGGVGEEPFFLWPVFLWPAECDVELAVLRGHEGYVTSVSYSPDGRRIVSGSRDGTVRVWDAESGAELAVLRGHEGRVENVSYSPDGRRIAIVSSGDDNTVWVWDAESGTELAVLRGHEGGVQDVSYSPDSRRIASRCYHIVRVWDVESGAELSALRGHKDMFFDSVFFSPDGRRIVSGSDGTVRVWDAESGAELVVLRGHEGRVENVSYSPDGRRIAIVSSGDANTVRVWDAESGAELAVLRGHEKGVTCVSYSPDSRRIASGSYDGSVRVWDVESGAELAALRAREESVICVAYSPDGRQIASGSGLRDDTDHTVRVWDVESGVELAVLRGHETCISRVLYSPDGRRIASRSWDGTVLVWNTQTSECLNAFHGLADVDAIAAGPAQFPWRALARDQEMVIEDTETGNVIARYPVSLENILIHPNSRTWAGTSGNHLYIIKLEGDPKPISHNNTNEDHPN